MNNKILSGMNDLSPTQTSSRRMVIPTAERRPFFKGFRLFFSWAAFFSLLSSFSLLGQTYETTGASNDWNDPDAWICSGGGCADAPYPDNFLEDVNVFIRHDINYNSRIAIRIDDNSSVNILQGAHLSIASKLDIRRNGRLAINDGSLWAGQGILNNRGEMELTRALVEASGSYVNKGTMILDNSCNDLLRGTFINTSTLLGSGSVRTQNGSIINGGTWSPGVAYCSSYSATNLPGTEDCNAVEEICNCLVVNCDILPGYNPTTKVNDLMGSELMALSETFDPNGDPPSEAIYFIRNNEVLIEIIVLDGKYNDVVNFLAGYGIVPADFIDDRITMVDDELLITLFFPISGLADLNQQTSIINFARPVSRGLNNAGLISSQGDLAQGSSLGRLGWNLSGAGVKVGVISDSYAINAQARDNDIANGDLPGTENPVVVVQEYPFGLASDEGRAMLQIVHDVAPDAQLFFKTGFISEGNLAFGIRQLREDYQCDVIVDDVQYLTEPFFRDGLAAQAIDEVVADG
ncbi:MAG: hypothetical protein KDC75_19230, partial [Phaeodactylibacter sp.]|nr:hypothetical protein [Phaeodactylibacter sp.]